MLGKGLGENKGMKNSGNPKGFNEKGGERPVLGRRGGLLRDLFSVAYRWCSVSRTLNI